MTDWQGSAKPLTPGQRRLETGRVAVAGTSPDPPRDGRQPRHELNLPSNLITLCGTGTKGCRGWVEAHPVEARESGWRLARGANPATMPVRTFDAVWLLLHDDGGWSCELAG